MLQHVFNNNHNNINMNDIQNSNNYSHIITLPSSTLATLPGRPACAQTRSRSSGARLYVGTWRMQSERPARARDAVSRWTKGSVAFVVRAWYLHLRWRRRCSQALPVNLRNSIKKKKIWRDFLGKGGEARCVMEARVWYVLRPMRLLLPERQKETDNRVRLVKTHGSTSSIKSHTKLNAVTLNIVFLSPLHLQ